MRLRTLLLTLPLVVSAAAIPVWHLTSGSRDADNQADAKPASSRLLLSPSDPNAIAPVPIVAATVKRRDVPEYRFGIGRVRAFKTVTIGSRIDGRLLSLNFKEGQEVHAGDVLAQLDPRQLEAAVHQMEANIKRDNARLRGAEVELARL
jgi:multidrug efflux system membrane fusion protein